MSGLLGEVQGYLLANSALLPLLLGAAAGLATAVTFLLRRAHHPRIQFRVGARFVGRHGDDWIVEYLAFVENRGDVPHQMRGLVFDVRGLARGEALRPGPPEIRGQVFFSRPLVPRGDRERPLSLMPTGEGARVTLYPGTSMRYMYVDRVPPDIGYVLIHGMLTRSHGEELRADRVVQVPAGETASAAAEATGR